TKLRGWSLFRSDGIGTGLQILDLTRFLQRTGAHFAGKRSLAILALKPYQGGKVWRTMPICAVFDTLSHTWQAPTRCAGS
ncbi:MAG: hypothetical protein ACREDP_00535, partial [Bradyrhizobium sp.]